MTCIAKPVIRNPEGWSRPIGVPVLSWMKIGTLTWPVPDERVTVTVPIVKTSVTAWAPATAAVRAATISNAAALPPEIKASLLDSVWKLWPA